MIRPPPSSPLFPYTTLSRSQPGGAARPRRIRRRARQQVVELRVDNLLSLRIPLDQDVRLPQRIPRRAMLVQQAIESALAGFPGQSEIISCVAAPPGARGDRKSVV